MKNIILPLIIAILITHASQLHAEQIHCVVTVIDTEGRPIKDTEVSAWDHHYYIDDGKKAVEQLGQEAVTNADGIAHVRFEPDGAENGVFVFARKTGFAVGWSGVYSTSRIRKIRIVLDRFNSTAGIVTDEENQPIVGAKVTACPIDNVMVEGAVTSLNWPDSIFTTTTDHEGRFSFDCLAEWTTTHFVAEYPGRAYTHTRCGLQGELLDSYKAGTKDIHITMHPAGQIKGKILAKRGNTTKGIKLIARGERIRTGHRFITTSKTDGSFSFKDLPPDVYLVTTVIPKGDVSHQLTVGSRVEVEPGQTVDNVKIRMRDPVTLNITVKNAKTNQPVRNAVVEISQSRVSKDAPHLEFRATTDDRGVAQLITLPGKCYICFVHDDYDFSSREYLVRSTDTNLATNLVPKSIVSGQVVYEDGRAAAGVDVGASASKAERKLTDRDGRFRIKYSKRMSSKRFVIARDMENGLAGLVDITENKGPVKVILTKAATLKGRVVDPDNRPINMAKVKISHRIPHYLKPFGNDLYTDKDGWFELRAVPYAQEGFSHRVSVSAYNYSRIDHDKIDVKKDMGETIELPPLVLKPCNMTVSGVAVYEDGSVASHKSVHLNNVFRMHGQSRLHSVTDADGKFHFEGACEGWLTIQCGYASETMTGFIDAKGGDTVTIVMKEDRDREKRLLHSPADPLQGKKLPLYEMLTQGIDAEAFENRKLLVCFWGMNSEQSKENVKGLTEMADKFDQAGIASILVNACPYNKKNASININIDKKWLVDNKVPFIEADMPDLENIMEFRRQAGARTIPHMLLTDENRIVTDEGFDIEWLKDNILVREDI